MMTFIRSHKIGLSNTALIAMLAIGLSYLTFDALELNPFRKTYIVSINLEASGGMQIDSDVTYRGSRVGAVDSIQLTDEGVRADLKLESQYAIPTDSLIRVANLSAAGEQYVDIIPQSETEGFLKDGSVLDKTKTTIPIPFSQTLTHLTAALEQLDPIKIGSVLHEINLALSGGADQLVTIINAADTLVTGLNSITPETTALIRSARQTLSLFTELEPGFLRFSDNTNTFAEQISAADSELRKLFDLTPNYLQTTRNAIGQNRSATGDLLKTLGKIAFQTQMRSPALRLLAPSAQRGLYAYGSVVYDGAFHIEADLLPRPSCEYLNPAGPPEVKTPDMPLKYMYCFSDNPLVGQRGAHNAPRPPGDNTATAPPGVTGTERVGDK
ncbi:MAG: MlaD family protein [Mycobacteriaceae bacterium]